MSGLWCVRADFGTYTRQFVEGGYVGIGWLPDNDLSKITTRDELYPLYRAAYPHDTSNIVVGQQVGQIARFLLEMKAGDYVITPASNTERVHFGLLVDKPSYQYVNTTDGCPYRHRRPVDWAKKVLSRSSFSVPFQNTIRSSLTVFAIAQRDEFMAAIGRGDLVKPKAGPYDPYKAVLEQILELDDKEFEILVGHLLTALGFEGSEVVGQTGDGGVDATGELNVANLAKVKVFVQAKRYQPGARISANVVKQLRQAIPLGGQGAFVTTATFQDAAEQVAVESGFPRIGLVNGRQLVDLLTEFWAEIPAPFQERLGLKPGLVRA
jgi:restriction system protein